MLLTVIIIYDNLLKSKLKKKFGSDSRLYANCNKISIKHAQRDT